MLKPLTLSISLAIALGASSVSFAGLLGHGEAPCTTCGIASPQGPVASAQSVIATGGCDAVDPCAKKKCDLGLGKLFAKLHQPKVYTYEWVLKKKKVKHHAPSCGGCDTCATAAPSVYPSAQYATPQGGVAPSYQAAPSGQAYSTGQIKTGMISSAIGDVPPPPAVTASPLFLSPAGN